MLSVCGPPPPPPPPLPEPLQPAIPEATHANRIRPAKAYPSRLPIDNRRCIARNAISNTETMPSGSTGTCGRVRGFAKGTNSESAVVSVAVHDALVEALPDVGTHVTALPKLLDPFLNCTVPVGPAPLLVVFTVAVSVTLPPAATLARLLVTAVVVVACVTVTATVLLLVLEVKLLVASAVYVAFRLYEAGVS
jgi:hypothetical protein